MQLKGIIYYISRIANSCDVFRIASIVSPTMIKIQKRRCHSPKSIKPDPWRKDAATKLQRLYCREKPLGCIGSSIDDFGNGLKTAISNPPRLKLFCVIDIATAPAAKQVTVENGR